MCTDELIFMAVFKHTENAERWKINIGVRGPSRISLSAFLVSSRSNIVQNTGANIGGKRRGSAEAGNSRSYKSMDFNERESDLVSTEMMKYT